MNKVETGVARVLRDVGAVMSGHFVFTSGKHGSMYINKDALYPHTQETSLLCHELAHRFRDDQVEMVVAPAIGGVILSQWTAYHFSGVYRREVLGIYAEKEETGYLADPVRFVIRRGYDKLVSGKRVLVVEDVLTTGGSARKVVEAARALGGDVVGLGVLCNRGGITPAEVGDVPKLEALVNVKLDAWDESACPLCREGVPVNTEVGKGREFLARQAQVR